MKGRLTFAIAVALTSSAIAGQATMGDVSLNLPAPAGFCEMRESNPSDEQMLTTTANLLAKGGNKLLSMSADCQQLNDWRARKRPLLDDFAQYQASAKSIDKEPVATIAQTCTALRNEGSKILASKMPDLKARVDATIKKLKVNETSFIGVVAEDPNACYAGIIQQIHTEVGTDKTNLILFAITIVKNRGVFVYRTGLYGSEPVASMLSKLKDHVSAFYAANK